MEGRVTWRVAVAAAVLFAQVAWVVAGARPSLWAPFHEHAVYTLHVRVAGQVLNTRQSLERYHLGAFHASPERDENWETNDLGFVTARIEAVESARGEPVAVELRATVNGKPRPVWRWVRE